MLCPSRSTWVRFATPTKDIGTDPDRFPLLFQSDYTLRHWPRRHLAYWRIISSFVPSQMALCCAQRGRCSAPDGHPPDTLGKIGILVSFRKSNGERLICLKRADREIVSSDLIYAVRWESGRKYITYTTPDGLKCRDNKLHEEKYCKEAMEHEFRIRAEIVKRKLRRAEEIDGGIETAESAEQRTRKYTAVDDAAHCDPVRSAADDEQAGKAGGRNKLGAGGNSEYPAGIENARRPDTGAEVAHGDAEIADGDEQTAGTGWEFEREVFLQMDSVAAGFQPVGGPQVDHAGDTARFGDAGGVVWRGSDPRLVPLMPAVAGLAAAGTLMDEDEDAEEKRRRMEAKIAAENLGAAIGFAAGAAMAVKEKLDEQAVQGNQHEQTMGGF